MRTASELESDWLSRDMRYSMRRQFGRLIAIDDREHQAILTFRRLEAQALPGAERIKALTSLSGWIPPTR